MAKGKRRKPVTMVNRAERVQATPETVAKARGCVIDRLFKLGETDAKSGLDPMQHEAAWEILEAFKVMTGFLGYRPIDLSRGDRGHAEMGPKALRLWSQYVRWGNALVQRRHVRPHVVVEWLLMERTLDPGAVPVLKGALNDWRCA